MYSSAVSIDTPSSWEVMKPKAWEKTKWERGKKECGEERDKVRERERRRMKKMVWLENEISISK